MVNVDKKHFVKEMVMSAKTISDRINVDGFDSTSQVAFLKDVRRESLISEIELKDTQRRYLKARKAAHASLNKAFDEAIAFADLSLSVLDENDELVFKIRRLRDK